MNVISRYLESLEVVNEDVGEPEPLDQLQVDGDQGVLGAICRL